MNQILYSDPTSNRNSTTRDTKKIILFFVIAIIIFGIILIASGVFGYISSENSRKPVSTNKPAITVGKMASSEDGTSQDDQLRIYIAHDKPIDKVIWSWNDGTEETRLGRNNTTFEEIIKIPVGNNTFNLTVIDSIGIQENYTGSFKYSPDNVDIEKPTIDLEVNKEERTIKIIAKDETEIEYITYRWNNEEETRVEETDESKTIIEKSIPLVIGENTLIVKAVDSNGNDRLETQQLRAYTKPGLKEKPRQYGDSLSVTIVDEVELQKVEYSVNGVVHRAEGAALQGKKEITFRIKLEPGDYEITINAWNKDGIEMGEKKGKGSYTP